MTDEVTVLIRMTLALLAGGIIGYERTFHGRPAGFRTHTLVCLASSLLTLLSVYQWELLKLPNLANIHFQADPARIAQGIMTGIGFLGAGVIMKERLSIRGLTTAASIWITASIGIVIGMGFYFAAVVGVAFTLGTLSLFRWLESKIQGLTYGKLSVRFPRAHYLSQDQLLELIRSYRISATTPSYHLEQEGRVFHYEMTIRTRNPKNFHALAMALNSLENIQEFSIMPTGD
jgi:putative Mg2+ transporter-C (MgtC) family protein